MNKTAAAKIAALRTEALDHDDVKGVALCDAALAGDVVAAKKLGIIIKTVAVEAAKRAPAKTALERKMERINEARERAAESGEDVGSY